MARGNERRPIFLDDEDREQYLGRLSHYRDKFGFTLLAYCLMDNHVHLAIRTGEEPLSRIMAGVQSSFTQWFNRRHRRPGHLFQGRYKAFLVQEDPYLLPLVRYIHENPVEAGVVARPGEYRWSSDRYYRRGEGPAWLGLDEILAMFGRRRREAVKGYREFMARGEGLRYEDVESLGQVVKGDEEFALQRFERAREIEPRIRGLKESRILAAVGAIFDLGVEDLRGPSRRRDLSEARAVAGYLGRRLGGFSWARTARYLHRDESTLVRNIQRLEEVLKSSARLRRRVSAVVKRLRSAGVGLNTTGFQD